MTDAAGPDALATRLEASARVHIDARVIAFHLVGAPDYLVVEFTAVGRDDPPPPAQVHLKLDQRTTLLGVRH